MTLVLFHLKILAALSLFYLFVSIKEIRSLVFGYLVLAIGSVIGLHYLEGKTGFEGRVFETLTMLPSKFHDQIAIFNFYYPRIIVGLFLLVVLRIIYVRKIGPHVNLFVRKYLKVSLDKKKDVNLNRIVFRVEDHCERDGEYFVGLNSEKKPIVMNERLVTQGIQVVGPPGTGKSVLLFNYAVQSIKKGKACCFIDGKGDMSFVHLLQGYFGKESSKFLFFTPTTPNESHTYNPLISIQDPGELADLLAVGLNLNVPGPGKVYSDTQKAFLLLLFNLFLASNKKFNFIDILTFANYPSARDYVYSLVGERHLVDDMEIFFRRLKKGEPELLGLTTLIQKLFCADAELSKILNVYSSDIVVKDILDTKKFCLFSLSSGKKAETNEALAKMVIADVSNAVGERMARSSTNNDFAMLILDEFGQYAPTGTFDKFISTARGSNIGCILSHQSNAQLTGRDGIDRLAPIVRECTSTTILFRQSEEADFWARVFGTRESLKRTDVIEESEFLTEKISNKGSLRQTDEFLIHPNILKTLATGQVAFRSDGKAPELVSVGMFSIRADSSILRPEHVDEAVGLNLRSVVSGRNGGVKVTGGPLLNESDATKTSKVARIRLKV